MAALELALTSAPLWAVGLPFFALLVLTCLTGQWLRGRFDTQRADSQSDGYLLSAALALLGLLIAFTFSLAVTRYDTRRTMVVAEGNAISTAWLRATLVEGPEGQALRAALKRYTDIRLRLPDSGQRRVIEAQTNEAQAMVWSRLKIALPAMSPPIGATLVAERQARIPGRVLDVVSLYALLSAGIVGYVLGRRDGQRHLVVTVLLFLLLTLAMVLILDLDRPWSGGITISPQPIIDARTGMN
ncbi:MAG: hypothetical protein ABS86_06280 [Sphingobium sp. SCN 64-10]|nr:MAG: hypothetical protein ABS86_06280 [Sphingobium sp. SCN 64-10]